MAANAIHATDDYSRVRCVCAHVSHWKRHTEETEDVHWGNSIRPGP